MIISRDFKLHKRTTYFISINVTSLTANNKHITQVDLSLDEIETINIFENNGSGVIMLGKPIFYL